MLMPVVAECYEQTGFTRGHRLHLLGVHRLPGRPAVQLRVDARRVGVWPPIQESHVEMDGAWALYEAWVKLQLGEIDTALVYALRQVVARRPAWCSPASSTRTRSPRCGPTPRASPPSRPGRCSTPGGRRGDRWPRWPTGRARRREDRQPQRPAGWDRRPSELLGRTTYDAPRCASTTAPRSPTAPPRDRAGRRRRGPRRRRAPGVDPRHRPPVEPDPPRLRDLTGSPSTRHRRRRGGGRRPRRRRAARPVHPPGADPAREPSASATTCAINPSGGPLAANPMMTAGLIRIGEAATRPHGPARRRGASPTPPAGPACSRTWSPCWKPGEVSN